MRIVRVMKGREGRIVCETAPTRATLRWPGGADQKLTIDGSEVIVPGALTAQVPVPAETFGCCDCDVDIDGESCCVQVLANPYHPEVD